MNANDMTTAANVVTELNAIGIGTRPLTGREFPVPMWVAQDAAYRWRLVSVDAGVRILREAFPSESESNVRFWASCEDLRRLSDNVRRAVEVAVCPRAERQEAIDALERMRAA